MVTDAAFAALAALFVLVVILTPTLLLALANLAAMVNEPDLPDLHRHRNGDHPGSVRHAGKHA